MSKKKTSSTSIAPMAVDDTAFAEDSLGVRVMRIVKKDSDMTDIEKADAAVMNSNAMTVEDTDVFANHYVSGIGKAVDIIRPTYNPIQLFLLTHQNNTLGQAIAAMEVNIDGTGYVIEPVDTGIVDKKTAKPGEGTAESPKEPENTPELDAEKEAIEEFFKQPYPGVSFTTIRRNLRRDLESGGNGYLEIIRSVSGDITLARGLDAKLTRMARLSLPVDVSYTLVRGGAETTVKMSVRERRFAQTIGNKLIYFKEFGALRDLDKFSGEWAKPGETIPPKKLATEVIHFTVVSDVLTDYGVPRWINQVPSVLGSRKAEEFNLEFFNSGGMPPAMILIQGGSLSSESRTALTAYLSGSAKHKQRAVVAEIFSTSGDIGSAGSVRVTVERFGSEKQNDSMFEKYDERCGERVRGAFRIPPLFLGLAKDYNFATAKAAYMVAEAQVFAPERDEFDEIINVTIMKELAPNHVYRSLPLGIRDVEIQVKALVQLKGELTREAFVNKVSEVAHLEVTDEDISEVDEREEEEKLTGKVKQLMSAANKDVTSAIPANVKKSNLRLEMNEHGQITKANDDFLMTMADEWASHLNGDIELDLDQAQNIQNLVKTFDPATGKLFKAYVGLQVVGIDPIDPTTTYDLISAAGEQETSEDS